MNFFNFSKGQKRGLQVKPESAYVPPVPCGITSIASDATSIVDNDTAMRFTAVYCAMRIRSENIASLPKSVFKNTSYGKEADPGHPVYRLIHARPNGYMNVFSFWEYVNACLDGWGNAYLIIERDNAGNPVALHPIHPSCVTVTLYNLKKFYRVHSYAPFTGIHADENVCHFFLLSKDGIKGINPITYNADAIGTGIAATSFGKEFFAKGGNIKAVLETDGHLTDEMHSRFMNHYNDATTNFKTALLEYGVKYKAVGISPEAAQMLNTKTFAIGDIARIFNIPPHLLADLSKATFSNIEEQNIQFVQYSLRPSVKRIETELETKLFFSREQGKYEVKFDLNGLMRGNLKSRGEYYNMMITCGVMNRNEVRKLEGLKEVDGLDKFTYQLNMGIVGEENTTTEKK